MSEKRMKEEKKLERKEKQIINCFGNHRKKNEKKVESNNNRANLLIFGSSYEHTHTHSGRWKNAFALNTKKKAQFHCCGSLSLLQFIADMNAVFQ